MATTSKTTLGDELRSLPSGINANLHDATVIGGVTYTRPQLSDRRGPLLPCPAREPLLAVTT
jgi:hypothetical protein